MLPNGFQQKHGSISRSFKTIMDCWMACTYGYNEPDRVRASKKTLDFLLADKQISFREAEVIVDDTLPDGVIDLYNSKKLNNPLYHGRIIFDDFPGAPDGHSQQELLRSHSRKSAGKV